jgi:hypothetical protein
MFKDNLRLKLDYNMCSSALTNTSDWPDIPNSGLLILLTHNLTQLTPWLQLLL